MAGLRVDLHALQFAVVFTGNLLAGFIDRSTDPALRSVGAGLLAVSVVLFVYVLVHLRRGFLGDTEPVLDHLVTEGPYRFCRHPLYLCFLMMVLGAGLYMGSTVSVVYTFALSLPSAVFRAMREDERLRARFGEEWVRYAERVGMFLPRVGRLS